MPGGESIETKALEGWRQENTPTKLIKRTSDQHALNQCFGTAWFDFWTFVLGM